jgi:hypothetical protein
MPDNTEQVILDSISDLTEGETGAGDGAEQVDANNQEQIAAADDGQGTEVQPAEQQEQVDEIARELGFKPGKIPHAKEVERKARKLLERRQAEHTAALAELNQRLERLSPYESEQFQRALESWRVLDEDPERFLHALAQADPRYNQILSTVFRQPQAQPDPAIEPDTLLADGTLGYSPQAMQRLLDQHERRIEQKLSERFGPIEQDWRVAQKRRGALAKAQATLQDAQTWPGFAENQDGILQALQGDRSLSLEAAYRKTVFTKLAANRDEIRRQVLAELNAKPRAAAGIAPGRAGSPSAKSSSEPRDLEDVIRDSIAGLEAA